jgi:hypothetical protein
MMPLARTSVYVPEDCPLDGHTMTAESGGVRAWLYLGESEVGVWGSPAAMRRLAAAVGAAADAADRLAENGEREDRVAGAAA